MSTGQVRLPQVIIPYPGLCAHVCQDIVVYLRPETNGIQVESTLLKVLRNPDFQDHIKMVYLANLPGDFIVSHRIVEHHYATRLHFAAHGKTAFTANMIAQFERFFGVKFETAVVIGAFEALKTLKLNTEELFNLWVPVYDVLEVNGQLIKRVPGDTFIVNYDIPALLHKNNFSTDIAVMVFRTNFSYEEFKPVLEEMKQSLIEAKILDPHKPEQRVFHYSKGPFEQILDGIGYLFADEETLVSPYLLPFFDYLLTKGLTEQGIHDLIKSPIRLFKKPNGAVEEGNLLTLSLFSSFEEAYNLVLTIQE